MGEHAEQPHRLCIQQHSGALRARRHDFQGAEELVTHALEPLPEEADGRARDGAKLHLDVLK